MVSIVPVINRSTSKKKVAKIKQPAINSYTRSEYYTVCIFYVAGIFGYLNYLLPRSRKHILETLIKGLQRLEYRGYDSAGIAFDSSVMLESGSSLLMTE